MMYLRPLLACPADLGSHALQLACGWRWFDRVEVITRQGRDIVPVGDIHADDLAPLLRPRRSVAGVDMACPQIMGILNVTPDSFSDGGQFNTPDEAVKRAQDMALQGANILDIGGESTRPGAAFVPADTEIARTSPVITALSRADVPPISIDTRKAYVARAGLSAGARMLNDVSALGFDANMVHVAADTGAPICLMHAQGDPKTMQDDPQYDNVVLDVYDFLAGRIAMAEHHGVARDQIIVDPGIGFGKTLDHNIALLRDMAVFHGLGCPILLGASRKRFIGTLANAADAQARMPGSVAVALDAAAQGVQILRVHDVAETRQALTLWQALNT
ncbi:MAG: dihydropteroate synthase [Pseudomonadota bacterium]